ncbi:metalloendopeptidase [Coemansia sp. RSA 1933]|nr:metalloendopeptidase [Coemansia sp. RSA 1933]
MGKLSMEDRRLVGKLVSKFNKLGAMLDGQSHATLAALCTQINTRVERFCYNTRTCTLQLLFSRSELNGLPQSFFKDRKTVTVPGNGGKDARKKYIVTTSILDFVPVMKLAINEETRKHMYTEYVGRCPENMQLLQETVQLRFQAAQLLGYESYSDWVLQDTMAKSSDAVIAFLADLEQRVSGLAQIDNDGLVALKIQDMDNSNKPYLGFHMWDKAFYTNKMTQIKYGIDSETVRNYLPLNHVLEKVLDTYETLLGLRVVCQSGKPNNNLWHPDVRMYEVWETSDPSAFVGYIYLDLFYRKGKPTGSGSTFLIQHGFEDTNTSAKGGKKKKKLGCYPAAAVLVDLPNPSPNDPDGPLLSVGQVKTLVHELGHGFHIMCSKAKWGMLQGTPGVEQDFVEVPSLMMEILFTQPPVFRRLTCHYITREPMSQDLAQRICDYERKDGMSYKELLIMARFDLAIHSTRDGMVNCSRLYQQMSDCPPRLCDAAVVDHLMDSYSSMYYSYLWASEYALRMLRTRFLAEKDCAGSKIGAEYRREILQSSGIREAQASLNCFLKVPISDYL